MHFDEWLLVSSVLLLLSILAWKVSNRLGIPSLLLFLGIGMLAGSDGPGGIYFDNASVAQAVGIVALAFILFAGGLDTEWKVVRPALGGALALSTIGVLLTAAVVAVFALLLLHVSFLEGLLLGPSSQRPMPLRCLAYWGPGSSTSQENSFPCSN